MIKGKAEEFVGSWYADIAYKRGYLDEDPIFAQIQKLTKLDKQTLKNNLDNNPHFEEDIIAIVQGIAKSVDGQQYHKLKT